MNVSYWFLYFRIKMTSTSTLKNKRKTVEELVEKQESWAFTDTKCRVDKKTAFKWNTLFQAFQSREFQVLLKDGPSIELSKGIYKYISKFGLHRATTKLQFYPI